jgi:hypothetical protein
MLSDLCTTFLTDVEALDPRGEDFGAELTLLALNLARDATHHIGGYGMGEIPALCQRCSEVLAWLKSEAEDTEDRQRRYGRQQAVLNLLVLCEAISRFYPGKRKAEDCRRAEGADRGCAAATGAGIGNKKGDGHGARPPSCRRPAGGTIGEGAGILSSS